jgi:hypothetical protein
MEAPRHAVVVEAYQGLIEFLSNDPAELTAARGLGLPLPELAEQLGCRFTVLTWDDWRRDETRWGSPFTWDWPAATRPLDTSAAIPRPPDLGPAVRFRAVPAREPDRGLPLFEIAQSPRTLGLIANSDLLVLLSRCLEDELARLSREDPFALVIVPLWGGLGHLPQMARAAGVTGGSGFDARFAVVVTDPSVHRQRANEEGLWTRPAQVRRQAEEMSLALADLALTFGPRGCALARAGRLPDSAPPVRAPRRVPKDLLDKIAAAAEHPAGPGPLRPFLDEPQDGASGVLAALDAVRLLAGREISFGAPVAAAGPDMVFAPMKPRSFDDYWSSRAWVRELRISGLWNWSRERPGSGSGLPLRLFPSRFEHLPDVWSELARGSAVLLSPAAAEGLLPGEEPPPEVTIGAEPTAERLADRISDLVLSGPERLDGIRRDLCRKVAAAHRSEARRRLLDDTAAALDRLFRGETERPDLGRAAVLLLDRTRPLDPALLDPPLRLDAGEGTLSVVLTCYDLGPYITEAVESVWASERLPDEVLLVDDGSRDEQTRARLSALEGEAVARRLPLTVLRQSNKGLCGARNAGLAAARGDFISFLDGDDLIEPPFYRLALDLMTRHPRLGGIAAWSHCFGPSGPNEPVGFWNPPHPELPLLFVENCVFVPCLTRTELLRSLGGYDTRQRYNYEDWELSVRLLAAGWPIVTIPAFLARYRVRPDSLLRTMTPIQNQVMRERLLQTHRETAGRFAVEISMQLEHRLKTLEMAGNGAAGAQPLWKRTAGRVLAFARTRKKKER